MCRSPWMSNFDSFLPEDTLYHTQGGGTAEYDEETDRYVFVDPAENFNEGDFVPEEWGLAPVPQR